MSYGKFSAAVLWPLCLAFAWPVSHARAAESYRVDTGHTSVVFRIKHLGISYFYGRFTDVAGTCVLDDGDPSKGSIEVSVKTDSVDTHDAKRDAHIKGPDFFNAREFPEITFKSTSIKGAGDDRLEVTGDLTLHGVTKPITVTVERTGSGSDPWGGYRTGLETVFTIQRSEFGMDYMLGGLSDEVKLMVSIEGVRQ